MSHFYDDDGNSCHEVIGKNGKLRASTIRDARANLWKPSVTTYMDVQAKPALLMWMQQQLLDTAVEYPFNPYEYDVGGWKKFIQAKTRARTDIAAKRGTAIHDALEQYYTTGQIASGDVDIVDMSAPMYSLYDTPKKLPMIKFIEPVIKFMDEIFPDVEWVAEQSFCNRQFGFGGRVDMYSPSHNLVLDFKTKDKCDLKDFVQYDDHRIQLAAYQVGLGLTKETKRYNLFISTHKDTPGMCKLVEAVDFDFYWEMFLSICALWRHKNKYDPRT